MLSKNARKKAARLAVRQEHWARQKLAKKATKAAEREQKRAGAPAADKSAHALAGEAGGAPRTGKRDDLARMLEAQGMCASLPTLAIDLSHGELMLPGERTSMAQQLMYSYASNKRAEAPLPLHFTSFGGETERALDKVFAQGWHVRKEPRPYWQAYLTGSVVVLSADASEVLAELEPGKVYVIGGIVDHNRYKGLVQRDAEAHGCRCARLPLAEHSTMESRRVLAVNQVVHMLLRFHATRSWPTAIVDAVPERKGLRLKRGAERGGAPQAEAEAEGSEHEGGRGAERVDELRAASADRCPEAEGRPAAAGDEAGERGQHLRRARLDDGGA